MGGGGCSPQRGLKTKQQLFASVLSQTIRTITHDNAALIKTIPNNPHRPPVRLTKYVLHVLVSSLWSLQSSSPSQTQRLSIQRSPSAQRNWSGRHELTETSESVQLEWPRLLDWIGALSLSIWNSADHLVFFFFFFFLPFFKVDLL